MGTNCKDERNDNYTEPVSGESKSPTPRSRWHGGSYVSHKSEAESPINVANSRVIVQSRHHESISGEKMYFSWEGE